MNAAIEWTDDVGVVQTDCEQRLLLAVFTRFQDARLIVEPVQSSVKTRLSPLGKNLLEDVTPLHSLNFNTRTTKTRS